MKRTRLSIVGSVAILTGLILIICLGICRVEPSTLLGTVGWLTSSALVVSGGIILYFWLTSNEHGELKDKYELLNGRVLCNSMGLTRHKCVVREGTRNLSLDNFVKTAAEYLSMNAGYKVRDLTSTYAILTRGSLLSRQKSAVLLIYVDKGDIVFEYRVAPLQASGLYDLRTLAKEVENLLTASNVVRDSYTRFES